MNISAKSNHQQRDSLLPFFLLTFLITWGFGALAIFLPLQFQRLFGELTDTSPMYFIAVAAPTISATLLTFVRGGWTGLGSLYGRLVRWRFGLKWYALVLLGIPAAGWIAARITGASLILGVVWGVWHLPSFFVGGMEQNAMSIPIFLLNAIFLSIFVTWVFLHTRGSVLIAVLIHFSVNFCATIIGVTLPTLGVLMLVANILILAFDKSSGWFHSSNFDHRIISVGEAK